MNEETERDRDDRDNLTFRDSMMDAMTCNELVEALHDVQTKSRLLKDMGAELERRIVDLAESDSWGVDRVGLVEIRQGSQRTLWDTDLLWSAVVDYGLQHRDLNSETGTVVSEGHSVGAALRKLFGVSPNFTSGGVKSVGLTPERFCEFGDRSRTTVKITPVK